VNGISHVGGVRDGDGDGGGDEDGSEGGYSLADSEEEIEGLARRHSWDGCMLEAARAVAVTHFRSEQRRIALEAQRRREV